jgi:nicotinamide-nucleotide amidase
MHSNQQLIILDKIPKSMNASIISIGQELLLGDTVNTNASWMGRLLSEHGIRCTEVLTIGDDADQIKAALNRSLAVSELVLMTGGLGPTHDDITKTVLLDYFQDYLVRDQRTFDHIKEIFERRGMPFSVSNHAQADVLSGSKVLFNKAGTAPGMWIEKQGKILVVMPGVPREMQYLMQHEVMPRLTVRNGNGTGNGNGNGAAYAVRYFHLTGIGESNLSDLVIGDTSHFTSETLTLAYLPHTHGITMRISSYAKSREQAESQTEPLAQHIRTRANQFIYSEVPGDDLHSAVVRLLCERGLTVATAESCSGGQLAHLITNVPGSSAVFHGGMVTYANAQKTGWLGVGEEVLQQYGAVSSPVALQMAMEVASQTGADFGLSTTGVAGPGGGTPDKPVGTVWIGFWSAEHHFAVKAQLYTDRLINKERSAIIALDLLRRHLMGIDTLPFGLQRENRT